METLPWYKSAIVRQQIVQFLAAAVAFLGWKTDAVNIDETVGAGLAIVGGAVALWTIYTRVMKPAPNMSQAAHNAEVRLVEDGKIPPSPTSPQAGFFRLGAAVWVFMLAAVAALAFGLSGCAGTKAAYKASASVSDTAYVVAEHYAAVVKEAANIAALPGTPADVKQALKAADNVVRPLILGDPARGTAGVQQLAARYQAVRSAENELELQRAIDAAVVELARFVNAVKTARR